MTSKLKPCPFCGGKAKYTENNGEYENHITCHECDFRMSGKWLKDPTTILKWNTRATPNVPELVRNTIKISAEDLQFVARVIKALKDYEQGRGATDCMDDIKKAMGKLKDSLK